MEEKEKVKTTNSEKIILTCPDDAYVSLQHIDKVYDNGVQAVFDFNLDVKKHEFIVLVGPSGCGKSTTLRMIAGLENITNGYLFIDGEYMNDVTPKDRNIAMVFQSYALYPHMTVYDNMAFSLKINKVPHQVMTPESQAKVDEISSQLSETFKEFRKYNKKKDKLTKIKNDKENKERDLLTIKDLKKKTKFKAQIDKLAAQLTDYDSISKHVQELDTKIDAIVDKLDAAKKEAKYLYHIDEKRVRSLENEIDNSLRYGDIKKAKELKTELNIAKTTQVPVLVYKKISKSEINRRVHEAARILQIEDYLDRKPKALSGGQRQRVALGRAIVRNAKVFLMDEPLSNLDAKLRVQMRSEIVKLHNKLNATTIYVTHDQTEAMTMATRIVIMKAGHIQQIGTPSEIYAHPANLFVAGFIGSPAMNLFDVTFENDTITFENGVSIPVPHELVADKPIPKKVVLGVRPEDIHPGDGEHAKEFPQSIVLVDVKVAELLGSEYYVHADFAGKEIVAKIEANRAIAVGDVLKVALNLRKLHFFDPTTERAI
jgi:multiple sugar transport system ATP-binding protein